MQSLKQAIAEGQTLQASILIAQKFTQDDSLNSCVSQLDNLYQQTLLHLSAPSMIKQERLSALVDFFYSHLLFSNEPQTAYSSRNLMINQVLAYRTGDALPVSMVFCELAKKAGFSAKGVNYPGIFLIRIENSDENAFFLDPRNGKFLSYQQLESHYTNLLQQGDDTPMPMEALDAASSEEIILKLLQDLKTAFLYENNLVFALETIELLILLRPDDPYERRDRGFLLQQLECPQMAKLDYQYFIRRCPQDPDAQILQTQMLKWENQSQLIFH